MTNTNTNFKTFMLNCIDYLSFGFGLFRNGVCDERIKGEYKLVDSRQRYGYTKKEASEVLGVSVRQFDRLIRKGDIRKGLKVRGYTSLFWDKDYIDKLSTKKHS